jgi:phage terminase large subunit-like protein
MAENVNPKNFTDAAEIGGSEIVPVHQPDGWRKTTLTAIRTWLALSFAAVGDGANAVAAHLMELDPHTQYALKTEVPGFPPNDGNIYVMRNGAWEILNISL